MTRKFILVLAMAGTIVSIQAFPVYSGQEFLFGCFGCSGPSPMLLSLDGGATVLSTGDRLFGKSYNQGWWSATGENFDSNGSYFVGEAAFGHLNNNFSTFDISELSAPVSSATLEMPRFTGFSDSGALIHDYHLYDVITAPDILNMNVGASPAIFNDLGSGVSYGTHAISVAGDSSEILMLDLNANAIADLNTAIANRDSWFSIGGTLTPGIVSVPETGDTGVMMGSSLLGIILLRVRGRSVEN